MNLETIFVGTVVVVVTAVAGVLYAILLTFVTSSGWEDNDAVQPARAPRPAPSWRSGGQRGAPRREGHGEYLAIVGILSALMLYAVFRLEFPYRRGERITAQVFPTGRNAYGAMIRAKRTARRRPVLASARLTEMSEWGEAYVTVREADRPERERLSLSTAAARNLATTTRTAPQMQEITSRWLLKLLPWVQVSGGAYRVNRRLVFTVGDGRITFTTAGARVRVIPEELCELPLLRGFDDVPALRSPADRFTQQEFAAGEVIARAGQAADRVVLIAHGKVQKLGAGAYGDQTVLGVLADGDFFGDGVLADGQVAWDFTARALTPCTVLMLPRHAFDQINGGSDSLRAHSRVADLYDDPMDQVEHQLKLTVHALRERQEHELVNNRDFGLLHNALGVLDSVEVAR